MNNKAVKESHINISVQLDENNVPVEIKWEAMDGKEKSACKSLLLAIWDEKDKNTLKIDLWTKDMFVDDMKKFFHQTLLSLAETFERATNETQMAQDMRDFSVYFASQMKLLDDGKETTRKPKT